ncbi:beta barrel domain-containing protein [Streptomyces platensis]|uniref:beta barrel domain-containing protein n=1 Tax=Streptomyces platensis TaxID=58346 RepID=UPI003321F2B5
MATTGLDGVKVGDNLILATGNRYRGDEPVCVSRVGNKYVYVASEGRERRERFDRKTGVEGNQRGIKARLYTQEQYDDLRQRTTLFAKLLAAGIDIRHEARTTMSTSTLKAILDTATTEK